MACMTDQSLSVGHDMDDLFSSDEDIDYIVNMSMEVTPSKQNQRIKCDQCGKTYKSDATLSQHVKRAHTIKKFINLSGPDDMESGQLIRRAIQAMEEKYGPAGKQIISECNLWLDNLLPTAILFVTMLFTTITPDLAPSKQTALTSAYHQIRSSDNLYGLSRRAFSYLLPSLYHEVLMFVKKMSTPQQVTSPPQEIETDTIQSLHYIAGYFIRKLRSCNVSGFTSTVESWISDNRDTSDINAWTAAQNNGGLIFASKAFLDILLMMESISMHCLQTPVSKNCNLRTLLSELITNDLQLCNAWATLMPADVCATTSSLLLDSLVFKFCSLRAQAYAMKMNNIASFKKPRSEKAKPSSSLRETLKE